MCRNVCGFVFMEKGDVNKIFVILIGFQLSDVILKIMPFYSSFVSKCTK